MLKVAVLRVSPRPWGGRAFGVDERGREIWFKTSPPGRGLWAGNRYTAMLARSVGSETLVIEIDEAQVKRVLGQAPEGYLEGLASAFSLHDLKKHLH